MIRNEQDTHSMQHGACLLWVGVYEVNHRHVAGTDASCDHGVFVTDPSFYARIGMAPKAFLDDISAEQHAWKMIDLVDPLNNGRPAKKAANCAGVFEVRIIELPVLPAMFPLRRMDADERGCLDAFLEAQPANEEVLASASSQP